MDIYPQDIGHVGYRVMLYLRTRSRPMAPERPQSPSEAQSLVPLTRLRRAWMRGAEVSDETARHAKPVFDVCRRAFWLGRPLGFVGTLFWSSIGAWAVEASFASSWHLPWMNEAIYPTWAGLAAALFYYFGVVKPQRLFRELHAPLTEAEVGSLMEYVRDPLARDFLAVIQMILPLPEMADPDATKHLRGALFTLGEAIEELPEQPSQAVRENPTLMRQQAEGLSEEAQREADPVVARSLERRAQSLCRRAQTVASIALLVRRNEILREEVSEQIEALHTSISAFSVGSRQSIHDLADLAASIQRVAAEANAIAAAHTEIEAAIHIEPLLQNEAEIINYQGLRSVKL